PTTSSTSTTSSSTSTTQSSTSTTTSSTSTTTTSTTSSSSSSSSSSSTTTPSSVPSTTTTAPPPPCGPAPATGCRLAQPGRSSLRVKDTTGTARDQLKWTWNRGAETDIAEFRDPPNSSAIYRLCLYDASGNPQ